MEIINIDLMDYLNFRLDGASVIMKNYQNDVLGQMTRIGSKIEFNNAFEVELRAETWNKFQFDDYVFNDTYEYKIDIKLQAHQKYF